MLFDSLRRKIKIQETKEVFSESFEIGEIERGRKFVVYLIPITFLTLNPHNSRFQIELDLKITDHRENNFFYQEKGQKEISEWILDQNKDKNFRTEKDIEAKGQQVPGLITADGLIINGNRRFALIKKLYEETQDNKFANFKAVIFDKLLSSQYEEIKKLEIKAQFGKDLSLPYKRINTMLTIRDFQKQVGWGDVKIKNFFKWDGSISDLKLTLSYIDDYLQFCDLEGYYFVDGAEDQFKYLSKSHNNIKIGKKFKMNWCPKDVDFEDYKYTFFKLLRSKPDQHTFRPITTIKKEINVFSYESVWKDFKEKTDKIYDEVLNDVQNYKKHSNKKVDSKSLEKVFRLRAASRVKNLFLFKETEINSLRQKTEPEKIVEDMKKNLLKITEIISDGNIPIKQSVKTSLRWIYDNFSRIIQKIKKIN